MDGEQDAFNIPEFCARHRISRAGLYNFWKAGTGPRYMMVGNRRRISREAAADWRRDREAAAMGAPAADQPRQAAA